MGFYLFYGGYNSLTATVFLLIWQVHYLHRTFIYPYQITGGAKPYPLVLALFGQPLIWFTRLIGAANPASAVFFAALLFLRGGTASNIAWAVLLLAEGVVPGSVAHGADSNRHTSPDNS